MNVHPPYSRMQHELAEIADLMVRLHVSNLLLAAGRKVANREEDPSTHDTVQFCCTVTRAQLEAAQIPAKYQKTLQNLGSCLASRNDVALSDMYATACSMLRDKAHGGYFLDKYRALLTAIYGMEPEEAKALGRVDDVLAIEEEETSLGPDPPP